MPKDDVIADLLDGDTPAKKLTRKPKKVLEEAPPGKAEYLSTGSTLLNLALSGRANGGVQKGCYLLLVGDSSSGKAQPLHSKVLTPAGWKRMGDLVVGDRVVDPDGGEAVVTGVFPQGLKETARVYFSDGSRTETCYDHLWLVENTNDVTRETSRVLTTKQMEESLKTKERLYVPTCSQVAFDPPTDTLPVPGYLLGLLLGNGHFGREVRFSSGDSELVFAVERLLPGGMRVVPTKGVDYALAGPGRGKPNPLLNAVRSLGLGETRAATKFVPKRYLRAPVQTRLEVLQGLLDTDATVSKNGNIEYTTSSPRLAKGVRELVRSLGGNVTWSVKAAPVYVYKGQRCTGQPSYRLRIRHPKPSTLFKLERKKDRVRDDQKGGKRRLVRVESLGVQECRCIAVSSKRHLYVTDGYLVTHNTWLSLQMLAEAANSPAFDGHTLVHDNAENGSLMDVRRFFGSKLAGRLEAPSDRGASGTVEEFYYNIGRLLDAGKPFVYVLDSMDAIVPKDDVEKFEGDRGEFEKSGKLADTGTYGTAKAKLNSTNLRLVAGRLKDTGSILVILSQTRDKIGQVGWGDTRTRAGGKSLKFYAHLEVWTSVKDAIKRKVKGKDRVIGRNLIAKVVKCRQNGWEGTVEFPFYRSVGIDDVGCLVDYLVTEGHWKKTGGRIDATEFGVKGYEADVIRHVDQNDLLGKLRKIARQVWHEIETGCDVHRKPRYQ